MKGYLLPCGYHVMLGKGTNRIDIYIYRLGNQSRIKLPDEGNGDMVSNTSNILWVKALAS